MSDLIDLWGDFPAVSKSEWLQKITRDLKGRPLSDLGWKLGDRYIDPFLLESDIEPLPRALSRTSGDSTWEVSEDIAVQDIASAHTTSLEALNGGVNAPRWLLDMPVGCQPADLLADIQPGMISLHFRLDAGTCDPVSFRDQLAAWITEREDPARCRGSIQPPPLPKKARQEFIRAGFRLLPAFHWITVDGRGYFAADPNQKALELSNILTDIYLAWEVVEAKDRDISLWSSSTQVIVETGPDYFVEIAKIRALQLLWGNLVKAFGHSRPSLPFIWAITAEQSNGDDAYSHLIAATAMAMSAAIGGARRITVTPPAIAAPTGRRLARNVQHLLAMESHFDKVQDPAAGSYYIEQLTGVLAEEAWNIFRSMHS